MKSPLLATKLHIPPSRLNLVSRPRLIDQLNAGLSQKLTLISAPAGFGKSTLIRSWAEQNESHQVAWLSLDQGDNDKNRFLSYFIAALQTIETSIGEGILAAFQSSGMSDDELVLTTLLNEIAEYSCKLILVLDDFHVIETQSINQALTFFLDHLPVNMHLVIATRVDPPLPLARLRARCQLTELRATDLRFTTSEAADFLIQVMDLKLNAEEIAALETRTEGWIAGLQMAAISMQGRADTASFIQAFTGSHQFILDYLIEEVLQSQPEGVRSFLLQTSILDRLSGPLCNAVTGQEDSKATLVALERENLFVIPLDDQRQWYRYHHLFADVLRTRLEEQQSEDLASLHLRASEWFEQNDLPSDAISHALAAEDFKRSADLAELAWPDWSGSYQSLTWLSWLKNLPDELVRSRPVLSLSFAWALLNAGNLEAAESRLKDVECWMDPVAPSSEMIVVDDEQWQSLPVSLATARAYHSQAVGNIADTVKYTRRVLDLLPDGDSLWRAEATVILGIAYWADGKLALAHKTLSDGLSSMPPLDIIIGTFVLADIKATLGPIQEAIEICERALHLAAANDDPLGTEDVYTEISKLHREQGDLESAVQALDYAKKLGRKVELPDWQYRWCIAQARLEESLGNLDAALDFLEDAARLFVRTPLPDHRPIAARKAQVWIKQGRLTRALSWVKEQGLSVDDELSFLREFEYITLARLLIAQNLAEDAVDLLERLLKAAEDGKRMMSVIEILVLQALAHSANGKNSGTLVSLERALRHAEPEGFVQIFVDEGPPMARLLYDALPQGIFPDYVQRLLKAFPIDEPEQPEPSTSHIPEVKLVEPLSEREIEVLQLIAEGLTNQEIASQLYITLNTVKGHARNIYAKLGVKNRTKAVAKAKALGIISSK